MKKNSKCKTLSEVMDMLAYYALALLLGCACGVRVEFEVECHTGISSMLSNIRIPK